MFKGLRSMKRARRRMILFVSSILFILPLLGKLSPAQDRSSVPFRLITQDNLWFAGPPIYGNYKLYGKWMIPVMPLLGCTDSWDVRAKKQELQWLLRYTARNGSGLVVSQEWIRPGDGIDAYIPSIFLPVLDKHGGKALWNIFYDPVLAATQRNIIPNPPVDFRIPAVRRMWEDDLVHLREHYFRHSRYWRIGGKPVLYVWNIPALIGADAAFDKARSEGVYLLGDAQSSQVTNPAYLDGLPPLDCATGFLVVIDLLASAETTIGEWVAYFAGLYKSWNEETAKRGMAFIPAGSCQYDDTEFARLIDKAPTRVLAKNRGEVEDYLAAAFAAAKPVGGTRYVFWGTSNNWAEGTTLLPTKIEPPERRFYVSEKLDGKPVRRIGNYSFEHLIAVKKILFPEETAYTGPVLTAGEPVLIEATSSEKIFRVKVRLGDCDFMGSLSLTPSSALTVENPPDLAALENLTELKGFILEWRAWVHVDIAKAAGNPQSLAIRFVNLDSKSTRQRIEFR